MGFACAQPILPVAAAALVCQVERPAPPGWLCATDAQSAANFTCGM